MIELLAGIPSVVLGFFALIVMASWIQMVTGATVAAQRADRRHRARARRSSRSSSPSARTRCARCRAATARRRSALGASRWQTAWSVILPAAGAGVAAGVLLGLARAVGETMIVLMASGNAAIVSGSVFDSVRTLSATIAAELAEVVFGSAHYSVLFFLGALLFVITFVINVVAGMFVERLRRAAGGRMTAHSACGQSRCAALAAWPQDSTAPGTALLRR